MSTPPPSFRVLCVDDDPRTRRAVVASLAPLALTVDEASGREDALALAKTHSYGLVLMDQVLEDTSGLELIAELRAMDDAPLFALMTGVTDVNLLIGAVNGGSASYVVLKPWHAEELREIVSNAMARASARDRVQAPAAAPKRGRAARRIALASCAGLMLSTAAAAYGNVRHEHDDAAALAEDVAQLALRSPADETVKLLRDGVAFVAVTEADGALGAFAVDRTRVQVIGDPRATAAALRDSAPGAGVVVRRVVKDGRRAEVRVDRAAFAGSNAGVTVATLIGLAFALSASAACWIAR